MIALAIVFGTLIALGVLTRMAYLRDKEKKERQEEQELMELAKATFPEPSSLFPIGSIKRQVIADDLNITNSSFNVREGAPQDITTGHSNITIDNAWPTGTYTNTLDSNFIALKEHTEQKEPQGGGSWASLNDQRIKKDGAVDSVEDNNVAPYEWDGFHETLVAKIDKKTGALADVKTFTEHMNNQKKKRKKAKKAAK